MRRILLLWLALAAILLPSSLTAQSSVYSVLGLGFPGRGIGVRARALGSGIAAFDPTSTINPAGVAAYGPLTIMATSWTSLREFEITDESVDGLHETRFPLAMIGTRFRRTPFTFAASFTTYTDQTFELTTRDTVDDLRGSAVPVADRFASEGAVTDGRLAFAWQVAPQLRLGVAGHILSGSSRFVVTRIFEDPAYSPLAERIEVGFSGVGIAAGFVVIPARWIRFAGAYRTDTHLRQNRDSVEVFRVDLPTTLTGGVMAAPLPALLWSATVSWRSWSVAADDLAAVGGANAFDTWEVGTGIELGGASRVPLRVGFRYAQLPFSPIDDQPREINIAVGSGVAFAANHALFEFAVERVLRDGGGAKERAWQLSFALSIRP